MQDNLRTLGGRLVAAIMVALLMTSPSVAQSSGTAEMDLVAQLDFDAAQVAYDIRDSATSSEVDGCGSDHVVVQPQFETVRFSEEYEERGCAEVRFQLSVPEDAQRLAISFQMDRLIESQAGGAPNEVRMRQELVIRSNDLEELGRFPAFPIGDGASSQAKTVAVAFSLEGRKGLVIGWHFEDVGTSAGNQDTPLPSGQSLSSTLRNIDVRFEGVPLAQPEQDLLRRDVADGIAQSLTAWRFQVPASAFDGGTPELSFNFQDAGQLVGVFGPDGTSFGAADLQRDPRNPNTLVIPSQTMAIHGPGEYTIHRTSFATAEAETSLLGIAIFIGLLPLFAGVFAGMQSRRLNRSSHEGTSGSNAYQVALWSITGLYAFVLLALVITDNVFDLVVAPLTGATIGWLSVFFAVAAAFLVLGTFGYQRAASLSERQVKRLIATRDALSRSNKDLENFAYIASHDLQEPLRTIAGYSQLLERRYGESLDPQASSYLGKTVEGAKRMQRLIEDLLVYARLDTQGKDFATVDMGKVAQDLVSDLDGLVKERKAILEIDSLPTVHGDRGQLTQVLSNLVRNAIKYTPDDRTPIVRIDAFPDDGRWHFTVTDNGVGIAKDQQERVFKIFQRLVPKGFDDGTGLGLAIVEKVVHRHGGRVWIDSEEGKGSTFHFTLAPVPGRPLPVTAEPTANRKKSYVATKRPKKAQTKVPRSAGA